jgi:hypothetical protein
VWEGSIARLVAGEHLFLSWKGERNVSMVNKNETVHQNCEERNEHEVQTTTSSMSEQVTVMEATSFAHSAVSSLSHSSSVGDELNADETRSQHSEELKEPEIDIVTGGAVGMFNKVSWANEVAPQVNQQAGKGPWPLNKLSDSTKNWLFPSSLGGLVATGVGAGGEAYSLYGKPKIMGQKK